MAGQASLPDGFERQVGTVQATAINMTQMCGIGPFVTIPLMVIAMGGPQAMFGWLVGALIVLADGLIWAELAFAGVAGDRHRGVPGLGVGGEGVAVRAEGGQGDVPGHQLTSVHCTVASSICSVACSIW